MAAPAATVALPHLQNLDINLVFDPNFDPMVGFRRAMKVFFMSCLRLQNSQLYAQALQEYTDEMKLVYGIQTNQIPPNLMQEVIDEVLDEDIIVCLVVHKYVNHFADNANLRINLGMCGGVEYSDVFALDPEVLDQNNVELSLDTTYREFVDMVADGQQIVIRYEDQHWGNEEIRNFFTAFHLPYNQIHCEGFKDWIVFEDGIKLLISIRFEAYEANANPENIMSFHLHSIDYIITRRLVEYRSVANTGRHFHRSIDTKELTYIQTRVDPNQMDLFWTLPTNPELNFIKYSDLQIWFRCKEELKGEFCTCNEFCNLNAFFYHNPIYRFLLVQHNLIYIGNRTNIPDIYQFVLTHQLVNANIPNALVTPLVRLLVSANNQRADNWSRCLTDNGFDDEYQLCIPDQNTVIGLNYNRLRNNVSIDDICITTDGIPFFDQSLGNIKNYYKILFDLHLIVLNIPLFVDHNHGKDWMSEFEDLSQDYFHKFIIWSYTQTIQSGNTLVDNLFTEDFEYSTYTTKSKAEKRIIESRMKICRTSADPNGNPFNISFELQPFTHSMLKIWEYITKFVPTLSRGYKAKALKRILIFCFNLDQSFKTTALVPNFTQNRVELVQQLPTNLESIRRQMFIFYKLKTYFYAFGIQKYFIQSTLNHNKRKTSDKNQVFVKFSQIFDNHWIEDIFMTQFPNNEIQLFNSDSLANFAITHSFNSFYLDFYGQPIHEYQIMTWAEIMVSVINQYMRFKYWQQNNGDNRLRFTDIITRYEMSLKEVLTNSRQIYQDHILTATPLMMQLYKTGDHYYEVLDELVYWLVKSSSFMVLKIVVYFMSNIHELSDEQLINSRKMFLLSKPGFVPLFRTKQMVFKILDKLLTSLILDDIFDRILNTITQTKAMVKLIYKEYYRKLTVDWFNEIISLRSTPHPRSFLVIRLHLISGLSFVAHFINDFRKPSQLIRKKLKYTRSLNSNANATEVSFNQTWDRCLVFLTQVAEIERAQPFMSPIWAQYCQNDFTQYAHLNPTFDAWIPDSDHL